MFINDKIFNKIVEALLVDYSSVYYVNAITNEYQWYSVDPKFHSFTRAIRGTYFVFIIPFYFMHHAGMR